MANVIEIILRGVDQTGGLNKKLEHLKHALEGLAVLETFKKLVENIEEAENATAQLDAAFRATGQGLGITREKLTELGEEIQKTTKFSHVLVQEAESVLLTFTKVRGEAFERTIKVATDLAARIGTDLVTAVRQVGVAMQDPERGLIALRRAGVVFDSSQRAIIKTLVESGQQTKAQATILTELEKRFDGAAAAARNTLSGALTALKNTFGDLFEGTKKSTSGVVDALNGLTKTLQDPKIKEGIDTLINGFSGLAEVLIRAVGLLGQVEAKLISIAKTRSPTASAIRGSLLSTPLGPIAAYLEAQSLASAANDQHTSGYGGQRRSNLLHVEPDKVAVNSLKEINLTVKKIVDENGDLLRQLNDETKTAVEKQAAEFIKLNETLVFLRDHGVISEEERVKRRSGALDDLLPEFDLNEIKAKYITLKKATTDLGEFIKGAFQSAGAGVRQAFADMFYAGKFNMRSLVDVARKAAAEIAAAFATVAIKKAGTALLGNAATGVLGALFGHAAGGGRVTAGKPRWVGEEGKRELFVPETTGNIYNQRELASMRGGGGSIVYSPQTTVEIIERDDPEKTKREILSIVALQQSRQQKEFSERLGRNGVQVR